MITPLNYIKKTSNKLFRWGTCDCGMWATGLIFEQSGIDPCASIRGTYRIEQACNDLVDSYGGLVAMCEHFFRDYPESEDGFCVARYEGQDICGILVNGNLCLKSAKGVRIIFNDFTIYKAWKCQR